MSFDDENLRGSFTAFFAHGLLLIEDSESSATHGGWDAVSELVHFDTDSLYLGVNSAADGPVTVLVYEYGAPALEVGRMTQCFEGSLELQFGLARIHDVDDFVVLLARCESGLRQLRVYVDDLEHPERVLVLIT